MKRLKGILLLIVAAMILRPGSGALAAVDYGDVCHLCSALGAGGAVVEQMYNADFTSDIVITLMDVPAGDWKLEPVDCGQGVEMEDRQENGAVVAGKKTEWRKYYKGALANRIDVSPEDGTMRLVGAPGPAEDGGDALSAEFVIRSEHISAFDEMTLEYSALSADGTPAVLWRGKILKTEEKLPALHVTVSALQLRLSPEEGWQAALPEDADPDAVEVRAVPGLSILTADEYRQAAAADADLQQRVAAARRIGAWTCADGTPFTLYAIRDDGDKYGADKNPRRISRPGDAANAHEETGSGGGAANAGGQLSLALVKDGGTPRELAREEDGRLAPAGGSDPLQLEPGAYAFAVKGEREEGAIRYTLTRQETGAPEPVEQVVAEGAVEETARLSIAEGQRYILRISDSKGGDSQQWLDFELLCGISTPLAIDSAALAGNTGAEGEPAIAPDDLAEDRELRASGNAAAGAGLRWSLALSGAEEAMAQGRAVADENGEWEIAHGFDEGALKDLEGSLVFEIRYEAAGEPTGASGDAGDPASGLLAARDFRISTKVPRTAMTILYGDREEKIGAGTGEIVFEERQDASLTVRYGEEGSEMSARTFDLSDLPETQPGPDIARNDDGTWAIGFAMTDGAGHTGERLEARVRIIRPVSLAGAKLGERELAEEGWINAEATERGERVAVEGGAEGGAQLEYRFFPDEAEAGWQTLTAGEAGEGGAWRAECALDAQALKDAQRLCFEIRYKDEAWRAAGGEARSTRWRIDVVPPQSPAISVTGALPAGEGGEGLCVVETGSEAALSVLAGDGAQLGALTLNGADITADAPGGSYALGGLQSGEYAFAAAARDEAGNLSAPAELKLTAVQKIEIARAGGDKALLNAADLENGLLLNVVADAARRDLEIVCRVAGEEKPLGEMANGQWQAGPKKLRELGEGDPVGIELRATYADLGCEALDGDWSAQIDLWPPEIAIRSAAYSGWTSESQFFADEAIAVKVQAAGDPAKEQVSARGVALTRIDEEEFNGFAGLDNRKEALATEGDNGGGFTYYRLDRADAEELEIVATAEDDAGNRGLDALTLSCLPPNGKSDAIRLTARSGAQMELITPENAVTLGGKAKPQYRLLVADQARDPLPGKQIPVDNDGHWELTLGYDDLPEELRNGEGEWEIALKYPSDRYNSEETICRKRIAVDAGCALEWVREPEELDSKVWLRTDPGAAVTLILDDDPGTEQRKTAEADGAVEFELAEPVSMKTRFFIRAVDAFGNVNEIDDQDVTRTADHIPLRNISVEQTGGDSITVACEGQPGLWAVIVDDGGAQYSAQIGADGRLSCDIAVDAGAQSAGGDIWYRDVTQDNSLQKWGIALDRTPPELSVEPAQISDLGGEVTVTTEAGARVTLADSQGNSLFSGESADGNLRVPLSELTGVESVIVSASDAFANASEAVEIAVKPSPTLKAGFDEPGDGAVLDSRGRVKLTGWVVGAGDEPAEGIRLILEQGSESKVLALAAGDGAGESAVQLRPEDDRLESDFAGQLDDMRPKHCWTFGHEIDMRDWKKDEDFVARLLAEGADPQTLAERSFAVGVEAGRRNLYIALVALPLALLLGCLLLVRWLNRRIRRAADGRVDPSSGMTRLTERSQRPQKDE